MRKISSRSLTDMRFNINVVRQFMEGGTLELQSGGMTTLDYFIRPFARKRQ